MENKRKFCKNSTNFGTGNNIEGLYVDESIKLQFKILFRDFHLLSEVHTNVSEVYLRTTIKTKFIYSSN